MFFLWNNQHVPKFQVKLGAGSIDSLEEINAKSYYIYIYKYIVYLLLIITQFLNLNRLL